MARYNPDDEMGPIQQLKLWMDDRFAAMGSGMFSGAVQVLSSGFGKGVLAAAAITTAAIVIGMVASPVVVYTVGQSIEMGLLMAANLFMGPQPGVGLAILAAGGVAGSMIATHNENKRVGDQDAAQQADFYQKIREAKAQERTVQPEKTAEPEEVCNKEIHGHCARLMSKQQSQSHERTV